MDAALRATALFFRRAGSYRGEHEKGPATGAIGLRGLRETVRFLRWALLVQRVNIRGYAPDTPEGRTYANFVCVLQDMPSMMSCRASATMASSYSYTPSRHPSINVRNFCTAGQPAAAASSSTVARALTLNTSRH